MVTKLKGLIVFLLLVAQPTVAGETDCNEQCMLNQVKGYFSALDKVAKKASTKQDIEALLNLMHPSVKYEHFEYQANFDLTKWRQAFLRQLQLGSYDNGPDNEIRITATIFGKTHTAIEYSHGLVGRDGIWQADKKRFALFGFTEGKISLIREYW